jgi:hypothetical protein
MELKAATRARVSQLGWPDELITRFETSPIKDVAIANMAMMHIGPDRAEKFLEMTDRVGEMAAGLSFGFIRTKSERGIRAVPGPNGLGTPEINIGTYGQAPDFWPYENDTPLGSHPDLSSYLPGSYYIYEKAEVWADGVDHLYEEAIRERWIPSTTLDWNNGLKPLPEELEKAICQLATTYSSHALVEQKIIAKWLEPISYGFHDVMLYLGTYIYDAGHKVEALRKRAVANGGGLGKTPLGTLYRGWYGALKFTEMMTALAVVYKSYEVTLFDAYADFAKTDLDAQLFGLLAKDSHRHLEYGKRHLLWYLQHHEGAHRNIGFWLSRGELALSNELRHDHTEREALALLLGGGMESINAGVKKLGSLRQKQLQNYIGLLDSVGIDRLGSVNPGLAKIVDDPLYV